MRGWRRGTLIGIATAVGLVVLVEVGVRVLGTERLGVAEQRVAGLRSLLEDGSKLYRPYPYVQYTVHEGAEEDPTRPRDWSFVKREDALRIACLGGSTTWGGYPSRLQERVAARTERDVQVMNWGVPGWTTQETLINYFLNVQDYAPHIVVVLHGVNDVVPRMQRGFRSDYAHWRRHWRDPWEDRVDRRLVLVSDFYACMIARRGFPGTRVHDFVERPADFLLRREDLPAGSTFERNLLTIGGHVEAGGGRFVLVTMALAPGGGGGGDAPPFWNELVLDHNRIERELCETRGYLLVDQEARVAALGGGGAVPGRRPHDARGAGAARDLDRGGPARGRRVRSVSRPIAPTHT